VLRVIRAGVSKPGANGSVPRVDTRPALGRPPPRPAKRHQNAYRPASVDAKPDIRQPRGGRSGGGPAGQRPIMHGVVRRAMLGIGPPEVGAKLIRHGLADHARAGCGFGCGGMGMGGQPIGVAGAGHGPLDVEQIWRRHPQP
jgi:hypothetical protein